MSRAGTAGSQAGGGSWRERPVWVPHWGRLHRLAWEGREDGRGASATGRWALSWADALPSFILPTKHSPRTDIYRPEEVDQ